MNTIAPPPQIKRIPPRTRAFGIFLGFLGGGVANVLIGYGAFTYYTRQTVFLPLTPDDPTVQTPTFRNHNKLSNPPVCIDHAVRVVPLNKLKETDQKKLTTDFCRGVWSGLGYAYQRRYLEKKYRALEGREGNLWERKELAEADYAVGTRITDHFEVVEHTDEKVRTISDSSWFITEWIRARNLWCV